MSADKIPVQPVILCGGSGTRLWPLSRAGFPKQFLCLTGDDSLFQQAAQRLVDHELIEFVATIPTHMKRGAAGGKLILKQAVKDLLPTEILHKPKTGFSIPIANWLRTDLAPMLRETLLDETSLRRGLFERSFLEKMINEHIENRRDWSNRLWSFLFLELWFREFID